MAQVVIALGSNLNNPYQQLKDAAEFLVRLSNQPILTSSIYQSEPIGPSENDFLNAIIVIETKLPPNQLFTQLKAQEQAQGRPSRYPKWAARTLDLDIIAYGSLVLQTDSLIIPHAEYSGRLFVLLPLRDVLPNWADPISAQPISDMINSAAKMSITQTTLHWQRMANQFDFIAIEGVIGAGKTSLARLLAEKRNARIVLEEFEDNPFLPKFYEDRERYAFQTQLAFLASRFKQQQNMMAQDLFHQLTISDYIFDKDRIFARLNLDEDELALYDSIFNIMTGIAAQPSLIVFIQASVERLMDNIEQRGREYEQHITPDYLRDLNNAYNHFFYHYNRTPVIFLNTTEIDFVNNPEHLSYIEEHLFERPIHSNTHIHIAP